MKRAIAQGGVAVNNDVLGSNHGIGSNIVTSNVQANNQGIAGRRSLLHKLRGIAVGRSSSYSSSGSAPATATGTCSGAGSAGGTATGSVTSTGTSAGTGSGSAGGTASAEGTATGAAASTATGTASGSGSGSAAGAASAEGTATGSVAAATGAASAEGEAEPEGAYDRYGGSQDDATLEDLDASPDDVDEEILVESDTASGAEELESSSGILEVN